MKFCEITFNIPKIWNWPALIIGWRWVQEVYRWASLDLTTSLHITKIKLVKLLSHLTDILSPLLDLTLKTGRKREEKVIK